MPDIDDFPTPGDGSTWLQRKTQTQPAAAALANERRMAREAKPYDVGRGTLFAILSIPVAIIVGVVAGQLGLEFAPAVGAFGLLFSFQFFGFGSRRTIVRGSGFAIALFFGLIAFACGVIAGFVSLVYAAFMAVGGQGGLLGPVFFGRLEYRLTERTEEVVVPLAIAAFIAIALVVKFINQARLPVAAADSATSDSATATDAEHTDTADYTDPSMQATASAPSTTIINSPSAGILLNGKPLDQSTPKKRWWQ